MGTITSLVELAVGAGCLLGGVVTIRQGRLQFLGWAFALAGTVGIAHAVVQLWR